MSVDEFQQAQIQALQKKVQELESENKSLKQQKSNESTKRELGTASPVKAGIKSIRFENQQ